MQNKGLITVFAILFGLVSIYQLSFTYVANKVEDSAKEFANSKFSENEPHERDNAEARYLDSIGTQSVFLGIDYNTAKEKELNKGLITVFAILFGLVSIYQLSFTYVANKVEDSAKEFANSKFSENEPHERDNAEARYLDSIGTQSVFLGIDYNTAKEKELNKG